MAIIVRGAGLLGFNMSAILLTALIAFCLILLLGSKIHKERKKNTSDFQKECLHSRWLKGKCKECGIEYKELEDER